MNEGRLEDLGNLSRLLDEYIKLYHKSDKANDKAFNLSMEDDSRRTRAKARMNADLAAEARDRCEHELHCMICEMRLAAPFDDSYYGEFSKGQASGQSFTRRKPFTDF